MKEKNEKTLEEKCKEIIEKAPSNVPNDYKMRYLYYELGKILAKNTEFFYDADEKRQQEIYQYPHVTNKMEVICKSAIILYCDMAEKLNLKCKPLEFENDNFSVNHWAMVYENDNKQYLINPIPDFFRIQMGFSTRHFCYTEEHVGYDLITFNRMSDEYLREMDRELGYLAGNMYTEELLRKLSAEISGKMGTHIVKTSDPFQEYYLTMLEVIDDDTKSIEEKLKQIKEVDPQFEKNESIIKECLEEKTITGKMRKTMHRVSFQQLLDTEPDLDHQREGAGYIGIFDITKLKEMKKEILNFKFNYMMQSISQFMEPLTGFIEKKNFIDEAKKYFFNYDNEKSCLHRHTVVGEKNGEKEYYMIFALATSENDEKRTFCFYDPQSQQRFMDIEPLSYMEEHGLQPLTNSSLNTELIDQLNTEQLIENMKYSIPKNVNKKR